MATLPDVDREKIWVGLMRWWSKERERIPVITKDQLRDAVDATDEWIEDNQVSFNTALPEPARTNLMQVQKTLLFMGVAAMRAGADFARRLFGDLD